MRCGSNGRVKDGHANGRQTYRCRECLCRFMPDATHHIYPAKTKAQAATMYGEGHSLEAIGRLLARDLTATVFGSGRR